MSSTVAKALSLLSHFGASEPTHGLSELARRASADKATVLRQLGALVGAGLLEQDGTTRRYRLGAELLRLAQVREASFPFEAIAAPALARLTELTGETAHASLLAGGRLGTVGISPSPKSSRVSLDPGQSLDLHATASGLALLGWSDASFVDGVLAGSLPAHTARTDTDPARVRVRVDAARRRGHAEVDQCFEDDVYGIATPLFDAERRAIGALAVATPSHRMDAALRARTVRALFDASLAVSRGLGGEPPDAWTVLAGRDDAPAPRGRHDGRQSKRHPA